MIRLAGGDPASREVALAGLNRSFPGWGGEPQLAWCYARSSDPVPADVLIHEIDGRAVAGLSLVYRHIARDDEPRELIGIYSGAWTDPEFRGHGLFGSLLDRGEAIARERGATMVLSFVTGERASLGPLLVRSTRVIEANLLTSADSGDAKSGTGCGDLPPPDPATLADTFANRADRSGRIAIRYDRDAWLDQFVNRGRERVVAFQHGQATMMLGIHGDRCTVLDMIPCDLGLTASLAGLPRRVTFYGVAEAGRSPALPAGWTCEKARIIQTALDRSRYLEGLWQVSGGDRM